MVYFCLVLLVCLLVTPADAYKTVVLVHGVNSDAGEFNNLKPRIEKAHPGTKVIGLNYSPYRFSLDPILIQLRWFEKQMKEVLSETDDDVHLVCHSQGGVVCMGYIMLNIDPRVHTFVVLSSPIFGQFGLTGDILDDIPELRPFKNLAAELVTDIVYTYEFQNSLSVANYWRDPRPSVQERYNEVAVYMPIIHNDPNSHLYNETEALQRKKNFLSLKKLVLFGGPDDEIIKPWQSPLFGYYAEESSPYGKFVNMTDQRIYIEDWIGLRTLHESGRLQRYIIPGMHHGDWVDDEIVFNKYIKQWLI